MATLKTRTLDVGEASPLTPPLSLDIAIRDGETVPEVEEERRRQSLCEDVRQLPCAGDMSDAKLANGHLLSYKMYVELDVFGTPVMYGIPRHVYRRYVVAESHRRRGNGVQQLAEELSEPRALRNGVGDGSILRLGARSRNRGLTLGRPRDERGSEEDAEARRRASGVRASGPVSV